MPETIVLGYDDSPSANAALAEAIRVAPLLDAAVVVVFGFHVSALGGPITGGESRDFRAQLEQVGARAVKRAVSNLEAAEIAVTTRLVEAKPADAILQVAGEVGASRSWSAPSARTRSAARCSGPSCFGSCSGRPCRSSSSRPRPDGVAAPAPDVRLDRVVKRFEDTVAVDGISLEIPRGSFFALLGPSGCGKTTTLRMIGGFEEPTEGSIFLGDTDVVGLPPYKRDVNTVFQSYALFPHMSIFDNVAFGLERRGVAKKERSGRVLEMLSLVDLAGRENRNPRQLSGGQQQRVALARALVNSPRVLLLDEPLGALDLKLRKQMQLELKRIQSEVGITFVHVTHDQEEAMTMADTIAVMHRGRIEQLGSPTELYERPSTAFVANFLGTSNLLQGDVEGPDAVRLEEGTLIHVKTDGAHGQVSVGVRPEKIRLGEGGVNSLRGTVRESAYIGVATQIVVATAAGEISVFHQNSETGGLVPAPAEQVTVSWSRESSFVVDRGEETIE